MLNTDTRFRPDQRQYELGQLTSAEAEKTRLEQKQREYRKKMETKDGTWTPRFFEQRNCIDEPKEASLGKNGKSWQYRDNSYFEHRGKFDVKMELW